MIYLSNQTIESNRKYPTGFKHPDPETMLNNLSKYHKIDISMSMDLLKQVQKTYQSLPKWIEGYVPVVRQSIIGKTYTKALLAILEQINQLYQDVYDKKLVNYIKDGIKADKVVSTGKNQLAMAILENQQLQLKPETQIIWVPTQLGLRWRGKSVDYADWNSETFEFLFNTFQNSSILLSIPERLSISDDILYMDCGGDRVLSGGAFVRSPCLAAWRGGLGLCSFSAGFAFSDAGSVSGLASS